MLGSLGPSNLSEYIGKAECIAILHGITTCSNGPGVMCFRGWASPVLTSEILWSMHHFCHRILFLHIHTGRDRSHTNEKCYMCVCMMEEYCSVFISRHHLIQISGSPDHSADKTTTWTSKTRVVCKNGRLLPASTMPGTAGLGYRQAQATSVIRSYQRK